MNFSRVWAMPSADTFSIPEIEGFVTKYLVNSKFSIDPFARNCRLATLTNDINPLTGATEHMDAREFLWDVERSGKRPDLIIFDPPYSPRQISEHYKAAGIKAGTEDTQNAKLYAGCRAYFRRLTKPGAAVLSFGWNSAGMGKGWEIEEILLVCHGGAHNDTICMAERKIANPQGELLP